MPSLEVDSYGVPAVTTFASLLEELLSHAQTVKSSATIEPPLEKSDYDQLPSRLSEIFPGLDPNKAVQNADLRRTQKYAVIETAARDLFSNLIATISIDSPDFVQVWNLFDILSILSDSEQCDPALLFWLVEELLDSQTIAGCRKIFDFLESRRERLTSKHFKQKQLIILRTCNELLRRLSRAEDPAFCGRVFIFMFQSFPLGDKSSVNLRGEYHVENVTSYDEVPAKMEETQEKMDVDTPETSGKDTPQPRASKAVSFDAKKPSQAEDPPLDPDALYPMFWSLQASFNQPKKLFDTAHFADFKAGLEATMAAFRRIHTEQENSRPSKLVEESKRGMKRKRDDNDDELANAFNPKYLTSRDLFELEISDLSFRRHVLVQALIVMDFLLSLAAKAKEKLATVKAQNKSVTYADQLLSEDDTRWAADMKRTIADYLRQGLEGPYFYRVVETILSRDKNWVRWKIENCPKIERPAVSSEEFLAAEQAALKTATNKRLRPMPMGSLSLGFLHDGDGELAMDELKAEERHELPELGSFKRKIADDEFEIEMPTDAQTKAAAIESKASNSWMALRIASKSRLAVFDKIDDQEKIDIIFEDNPNAGESQAPEAAPEAAGEFPQDLSPVIISGPKGVGKASLVDLLLKRNPGVFQKAIPHTTRPLADGEVKGKEYNFVDSKTFDVMRDGDQLIEFSTVDGHDYGTSHKTVAAISEKGQVPVMQMQRENVQFAKDMGYSARIIGIQAPSPEVLEARLKDSGVLEDKLQEVLKTGVEEMEQTKSGDFYNTVIVNEDLETAYKSLESFIYGGEDESNEANGETKDAGDVAMKDGVAINGEAAQA